MHRLLWMLLLREGVSGGLHVGRNEAIEGVHGSGREGSGAQLKVLLRRLLLLLLHIVTAAIHGHEAAVGRIGHPRESQGQRLE